MKISPSLIQAAPPLTSILCNTVAATGTVITVPAGRWYTGTISLSASVAVAGASNPVVTVNGAGAGPASGSVVARLNVAGLALTTVTSSNTVDVLVGAPNANAVTLDFTAGANGVSSATINGFLL